MISHIHWGRYYLFTVHFICFFFYLQGDLWAESSFLGYKLHFYACMEGEVFDVTEWAACQVWLFKYHSLILVHTSLDSQSLSLPYVALFVLKFLAWIILHHPRSAFAARFVIKSNTGSVLSIGDDNLALFLCRVSAVSRLTRIQCTWSLRPVSQTRVASVPGLS